MTLRGSEATKVVEAQDKKAALKKLEELQAREQRAKESHVRARAALDKAVTLAVTSEPKRDAWHAYPGPLTFEEVREALAVSASTLHSMVQRGRSRLTRKR